MRIGLCMDLVSSIDRYVYREIASEVRRRGWKLRHEDGLLVQPHQVDAGRLDAYVTLVQDQEKEELIRSAGVPTVNYTYLLRTPWAHQVTHDHHAIGVEAAQFLKGLGLRSAVSLGMAQWCYSRERMAGFEEEWTRDSRAIRQVTLDRLEYFDEQFAADWKDMQGADVLFCATDEIVLLTIGALEGLGVRVPQDVAVMGVGHEEIHSLCLGRGITSVALDAHGIAQGVLRALDRISGNPAAEPELEWVPPLEVFPGETVRRCRPDHPGLSAVADILDRADLREVDLELLSRTAHMSRRHFERQFKAAFDQSPGVAIREARVSLARRLLAEQEETIDTVAERCGYADRHHFSVRFKKDTGLTPAAYRQRMRRL